jgi:hypothetical protein
LVSRVNIPSSLRSSGSRPGIISAIDGHHRPVGKCAFTGRLRRPRPYDPPLIATDPGGTKNVAAVRPEVVRQLTKLMERFIADGNSTPGARQPNDVKAPLRVTRPKKE